MTVQVESPHTSNYNEAHTERPITVHQPAIVNNASRSKTLIIAQTIQSFHPLKQSGIHVSDPAVTWWVSCVVFRLTATPPHTTGIISSSYAALYT